MLKIWILSALGPLETVSSFQREISTPDLRRQPWMLWVFGVFHWLQSSCLMTVKCPQSWFWRCLFSMCYHSSHVYRYDCCYCNMIVIIAMINRFFLSQVVSDFHANFLCAVACFTHASSSFVHVVRGRNSAMKPNENMFLQGGYIFDMAKIYVSLNLR